MRKNSRQREEIKKVLMSSTAHPTAESIYGIMKPDFSKVSLATVYRNLALLVENGEAQKIKIEDGPDRFDGNVKMHYHFHCDNCGGVFDLDYPVIADFEQKMTERTGFLVKNHSILSSGICKNCKAGCEGNFAYDAEN